METHPISRRRFHRILAWTGVPLLLGLKPRKAKADDPPQPDNAIALFIVVIIFIAVVSYMIWRLWKTAKRIPTKPPPDPDDPKEAPPSPPGNWPQPVATAGPPIPTGTDPATVRPALAADGRMPMVDINVGENGDHGVDWWDIRGRANNGGYETLMVTGIQGSDDMQTWTPEIHILGWTSRDLADTTMLITIYDGQWNLLATRYGDAKTTTFDFGELIKSNPDLPTRFYRAFVPQKLHN